QSAMEEPATVIQSPAEVDSAEELAARRYLERTWSRFAPESIDACLSAMRLLTAGGVPGATRVTLRTGRPGVRLETARFGGLLVLLAATSRPALRDAPDRNQEVLQNIEVVAVWKQYQEALLKVPAAKLGGRVRPRVHLPVNEIARNIDRIVT